MTKALDWFEQAAYQGSTAAQGNAATTYARGQDVPKDMKKAVLMPCSTWATCTRRPTLDWRRIQRRPQSCSTKLHGRAMTMRWLTWGICGGKEKGRQRTRLSPLQRGRWLLRREMKRPNNY